MLNYRQSSVIERNSFADEFEMESVTETPVQQVVNSEERVFNSRIKDNFDRIINYDVYDRTSQATQKNEAYTRLAQGANYDISPSSTTMQYKNMPKAEVYRDYREEETVTSKVKLRPRAKLAAVVLSAVIILLSVFVVLNTALLNNMNSQIEGRLSEIEILEEQKSGLDSVLEEVSSDEAIIDAAGEIGMIF